MNEKPLNLSEIEMKKTKISSEILILEKKRGRFIKIVWVIFSICVAISLLILIFTEISVAVVGVFIVGIFIVGVFIVVGDAIATIVSILAISIFANDAIANGVTIDIGIFAAVFGIFVFVSAKIKYDYYKGKIQSINGDLAQYNTIEESDLLKILELVEKHEFIKDYYSAIKKESRNLVNYELMVILNYERELNKDLSKAKTVID